MKSVKLKLQSCVQLLTGKSVYFPSEIRKETKFIQNVPIMRQEKPTDIGVPQR